MKKIINLFFAIILSFFCCSAKEIGVQEYEIQGAGTGVQGTYLVEVSVLSNSRDVNDADLVKAAVHGVLFRGFTNTESRNTQKPLAGSPAVEAQHADFYKDFFGKNGSASQFGNAISGTRKIIKSGKQFKVSSKVTVNKELLFKYLQDLGMIKSLNSGF